MASTTSSKSNKVSVIIPFYNEEEVIGDCLQALEKQSYKDLEIIVVDDGSTDQTTDIIKKSHLSGITCQLLKQNHKGPGTARNLGAKKAKGEILVFVDADMTFDRDFVKDLVAPIFAGETIGTFSKNEKVLNKANIWSICWNINRNVPAERMLPENYPDTAPVYRAILKSEFEKVGGFEASGQYTDDWSLSRKLNKKSTVAQGATYYHSNPASLSEVAKQARWIGKNEFISGNLVRRIRSLILYSLPLSLIIGIYKSIAHKQVLFIPFKIVYDWAIFTSVVASAFTKSRAKD